METAILSAHRPASLGTLAQGLYTYRLQAWPDELTRRAIAFEHALLRQTYGEAISLVPPGVCMLEFMAREEMEPTLLRWMHRIVSAQSSFLVNLQGYGALSSRRLYLRMDNQQPFLQMIRSMQVIDQYIRNYDCPPARQFTHLCMPITGVLPQSLFDHIAPLYAQRKLQLCFEVRELSLLRLEHPQDTGTEITRFGLQTL